MGRPRKKLPLLDAAARQRPQRLFPRAAAPLVALLDDERGEPLVQVPIADLGLGGVRLQGPLAFKIGSHLFLRIPLADHDPPLLLTGEVVRLERDAKQRITGLGVRFIEVDTATRERLSAWIAEAGHEATPKRM